MQSDSYSQLQEKEEDARKRGTSRGQSGEAATRVTWKTGKVRGVQSQYMGVDTLQDTGSSTVGE